MTKSAVGKIFLFIPVFGILAFGTVIDTRSQENRNAVRNTARQAGKTDNGYKIQVGVEEVRLDAVVVDSKGRQITDLTPYDFEIYQDRQRQEIVTCRYITHDRAKPGQRLLSSPDFGTIPPAPPPPLKRDTVERTFTFLVNDFGMGFEETYRTRMSLRKFVEDQMLPGDLVSIIKTSHGSATLQSFTSDRQELLSRIDSIQWSTYNDLPSIPRAITELNNHKSQLVVIDYCIKALQDMPGRKFLMLLTRNTAGPSSFNLKYDRMADAALRAGVVVHTMNARGIQTELAGYRNLRPISSTTVGSGYMDYVSGMFDRLMDPENQIYRSAMGSAPLPLSRKTGGVYLDNNFFINGIGDLEEEMKGYYLLSYIPPAYTFSRSGKTAYHDIEIIVKRKGLTIRTRDGFFGEPAVPDAPPVTSSTLVEAMFSPFEYDDLNVTLASGYIDNLKKGYLLPTWMHLDGRDLGVIEEKDGTYSVSFEAGASTADIDGIFQEYGDMQIGFQVDEEDIRKLKENGINFTISIPVKKPGGYYVRVAVKDQSTDAKGSAYQYIEIPDLKNKRLALSSLYIIDGEEDASWIRAITSDKDSEPDNTLQKPKYRNPARKDFLPGDSIEYMTVIYNAKSEEKDPPELEAQTILYRNGVGLYKSEVEAVDLSGANDFNRIPIRKSLHIEESMQPGDYVLQLLVKDNNAKEKQSLTAQTLSFKIAAE